MNFKHKYDLAVWRKVSQLVGHPRYNFLRLEAEKAISERNKAGLNGNVAQFTTDAILLRSVDEICNYLESEADLYYTEYEWNNRDEAIRKACEELCSDIKD